jgi:hypothetical protein
MDSTCLTVKCRLFHSIFSDRDRFLGVETLFLIYGLSRKLISLGNCNQVCETEKFSQTFLHHTFCDAAIISLEIYICIWSILMLLKNILSTTTVT